MIWMTAGIQVVELKTGRQRRHDDDDDDDDDGYNYDVSWVIYCRLMPTLSIADFVRICLVVVEKFKPAATAADDNKVNVAYMLATAAGKTQVCSRYYFIIGL